LRTFDWMDCDCIGERSLVDFLWINLDAAFVCATRAVIEQGLHLVGPGAGPPCGKGDAATHLHVGDHDITFKKLQTKNQIS
jgi:hypothetical protein